MRTYAMILPLLLPFAATGPAQTSDATSASSVLVQHALANELSAAQNTTHPLRYRLRKSSPRLTSTKEIVETRDGAVAMLVAINDQAPAPEDAQKEQLRLDQLLADPSKQRHRKQTQDDDTSRALKVLRSLPNAFLYRYAGQGVSGATPVAKFTFSPNPKFNSPDLETQVLTQMSGEIWVDAAHERVVRLEGHLQQDVDFGWGILGRLNKGGWITIDQAEVEGGQWRIVRFKMAMSGRVLFKTRSFDTTEEESQFAPVPAGMSYQQAIQMLRSGQGSGAPAGR
jgi:hypothetical protein